MPPHVPTPADPLRPAPCRVGITGHCNLTEATCELIRHELRNTLSEPHVGGLVGVSCLARGADQVFAQIVLECGGGLEVILPARDYRRRKVDPDNAAEFDRLIAAATTVTTMGLGRACRQTYMAASDAMLSSVHALLAVWDGQPAARYAGTADVITEARHRRLPVTVIWPTGAARTTTTTTTITTSGGGARSAAASIIGDPALTG